MKIMPENSKPEIDMRKALGWYPHMKNQYTQLGWKNCLFEFIMLWNGDVAIPINTEWKKGMEKYHDSDAQFSFFWQNGIIRDYLGKLADNMPVKQSYVDGWKPAIITTQFLNGLEIKSTSFAHVPGCRELIDGDEPMYLWIDFEVKKEIDFLLPEEEITFLVEVSKHKLRHSMIAHANSRNEYPGEVYAHKLSMSENMLVQDDGRIRLAVTGNNIEEIEFFEKFKHKFPLYKDTRNFMKIRLKFKNGKSGAKLLIPILPVDKTEIDDELACGYKKAFTETMKYWDTEISKGTEIKIPDEIPQNTFLSGIWRLFTIAEKNPVYDDYVMSTGAFTYDCLWPTPSNISLVWGLDLAGYHKDVERYLELYRKDQGNTKPPGEYFIDYPGFLSAPDKYEFIRWLNEHGSIMWAVGEHYLLTRDSEFLNKWINALLAACEWIYVQRRNDNHPGVSGIMPAGVASDNKTLTQPLWNDGWIYKGLDTVVKVLEEINHLEANKWKEEAEEYKERFNEVFMDTYSKMPSWRACDGTEYKFIPLEVTGKEWEENIHAFYLDAGPLFLAFSGLLEHDNYIFDEALKWFREGPHVKHWQFDNNCWQMPVLHHEMSSCEPCYSWNMDINFLRNDREHFIEGLFAQFAGARNTDLFSDIETRNGMFAIGCTTAVTFHHVRNGIVYENGNNLELLRMVPVSWLKSGDVLEFKKLPTYFGPMEIEVKVSIDGSKAEIKISLPSRNKPEKILLFVPKFLTGKAVKIIIDGKEVKPENDRVDLTGKMGMVRIDMIIS